jgi:putative ABC transport system permease protein
MKVMSNIAEAGMNLFSSKLRSLLALLGILVGTASVVAMVSGGELATNEAMKQFKNLGTDLLSISIDEISSEHMGQSQLESKLSLTDALSAKKVNAGIDLLAPYTQSYTTIKFDSLSFSGSILGVTDNFVTILRIPILFGRGISLLDAYMAHCTIGYRLYSDIKQKYHINPLGRQLQIGKMLFTVVGIAGEWQENSFVYSDINNSVMIPFFTSTALSHYATINNVLIHLKPNTAIEKINADLEKYLQSVVANKRFYFRSAKELINSMSKQNKILTLFLGLIGGISLLVGGIGVMNIMLVSVVERKREIGIRLAVGSRKKDIRLLFLTEAIILALTGGVLGVVVGEAIACIIALSWHWEFIFFYLPPVIGFIVSVLVGIFFGFYPAYQASQLNPIDALRSD